MQDRRKHDSRLRLGNHSHDMKCKVRDKVSMTYMYKLTERIRQGPGRYLFER
jgi:hypothetical protein